MVPQTNETISAASGPKFTILSGRVGEVLLFNNFFPIADMCHSCKDIARQSCEMVPRWRFFVIFWVLHFQRAARSIFQNCILSMVDIHSAAAEIRRGIKKEERKKAPGKSIMSASATQGGQKHVISVVDNRTLFFL